MTPEQKKIFERKFAGHRSGVSIENPYFDGNHEISPSNPKTIKVNKNIRESAIETLSSRGKLDKAQKEAADRFQRTWEACGGTIGAMDYGREQVDGGGMTDPLSERQAEAGKDLAQCRTLLGARLYELVVKVCGQGLALQELSEDGRERLTAADNLRASLDDLAEMWGIIRRNRHNRPETVR